MYVMASDDRISVDRGKAIEAALSGIEKRFGKGSIMRMGEREVSDIPAISTTSLSLDVAVGIGGVPRGRIIEIYGPESSGKTTLALHIVAEAQKAGGVAAYIDAEHAMDSDYAGKLGVDIDQLLISQPDSGEQPRWPERQRHPPLDSTHGHVCSDDWEIVTRLLSQLANSTFRHHACLMLRFSNQLAISVPA